MKSKEFDDLVRQSFDNARLPYNPENWQKLSGINCDRFLGENNLVALNYYFSDIDSIKAARMFLVFKNINSVMSHDFRVYGQHNSFTNIPAGAQTIIIAIGLKNGSLVADKMDVTAWQGQTVTLNMKALKDEEIPTLFSLK